MAKRAGERRHYFTIQKPTIALGPSGTVHDWDTPITHAQAWGSLEPRTGNEYRHSPQADIPSNATFYRVEFVGVSGVTATMRLVLGSRIFHIQNVADNGRGRGIWVDVMEAA